MVCLSEFCECAKQKYKRIAGPRCVARKMIFLLLSVCLWELPKFKALKQIHKHLSLYSLAHSNPLASNLTCKNIDIQSI